MGEDRKSVGRKGGLIRSRPPAGPVARFRLRISAGDAVAIGPGKIALLEAIAQTGSLTAAAKLLDMSYRRAWLLLDELNRSLKKPAVESAVGGQHGGGSQLTDAGRALVAHYRSIEETASEACAAEIRKLSSMLAR
jgi:molybdate transport system regulatory protein